MPKPTCAPLHSTWAPAASSSNRRPPVKAISTASRYEGDGAVGLWVWGTFKFDVDAGLRVNLLLWSARSTTDGLKESWSHPVGLGIVRRGASRLFGVLVRRHGQPEELRTEAIGGVLDERALDKRGGDRAQAAAGARLAGAAGRSLGKPFGVVGGGRRGTPQSVRPASCRGADWGRPSREMRRPWSLAERMPTGTVTGSRVSVSEAELGELAGCRRYRVDRRRAEQEFRVRFVRSVDRHHADLGLRRAFGLGEVGGVAGGGRGEAGEPGPSVPSIVTSSAASPDP